MFKRFVREFRGKQSEVMGAVADRRLEEITLDEIRRWKADVPPPGEAGFEAQQMRILEIARGFLQLERERATKEPGEWLNAEYGFGKIPKAVDLPLPDGRRLPLQGWVDRVDRLADGTLRIIDYKSGSDAPYAHSNKDAPLKGGRVLQAALYAHAVAQLLGTTVSTSQYWFPARDRSVPYGSAELREAPAVIASLLEHLRTGAFVPTLESHDCAFCDYGPMCRVRDERYHKTTAPPAQWAKAHAESLPEYAGLLARNTPKGDGGKK